MVVLRGLNPYTGKAGRPVDTDKDRPVEVHEAKIARLQAEVERLRRLLAAVVGNGVRSEDGWTYTVEMTREAMDVLRAAIGEGGER